MFATARVDSLATPDHSLEVPSGTVALGYSHEWSGVAKVSTRAIANTEIGYQAIVNVIDAQRTDWTFAYMPDGRPKQHTYSIVHGLDMNHVLNPKSFYNLSIRQNYFDYTDQTSGGHNNYSAHAVYSGLQFRF